MHQHLVATNLRKLLLRTTEFLSQEFRLVALAAGSLLTVINLEIMERGHVKGIVHRNIVWSPWLRSLPRSSRVRFVVFIIALSFSLVIIRTAVLQRQQLRMHERFVELDHPAPLEYEGPTDVAGLIAKIQAATKIAAGGQNNGSNKLFTPSMQVRWHKRNPCHSRREIHSLYSLRRVTNDLKANPKWGSLLKEYEVLHRTCVLQMGDVTDFFLKRKHINGCKFVVAGVSAGSGIGNKALSIVSALVYSILTQRVLFVPLVTAVPGVFCEPFEGSSWMVDPFKVWSENKMRPDLWSPLEEFYNRVDDPERKAGVLINPTYASSNTEDWDAQPEPRFFCDTEQAHYTQVQWINFRNNLYFVPKLFGVPGFRPVLEDLFPDRKVLTHVMRSVMLPCDPVWGRVRQVHDAHFRSADRRVGIQVRYFHGKPDFDLLHAVTEDHIEECLINHGLLPDLKTNKTLTSPQTELNSSLAPLKVTTIFVTSLYQSLKTRLTKNYIRSSLETGDAIGVIQLTHENKQDFGIEIDRQALTEILCLSLSDRLILTPQSTFGALAQGYGDLVPLFIDLRIGAVGPCVRAQTAETCYQIPASKNYTCPHDVNLNGKLFSDVVAYISDCHLVEDPFVKVNGAGLGMQLITASEDQT